MVIAAIPSTNGQFATAASVRAQVGERAPGANPSAPKELAAARPDQTSDRRPSASSKQLQLSDEALALIGELKARDAEVRQHEAAHVAAAGGLATSGPSFTYQRGPDGVNYAVGGEVGIDVSPGRTPQETIERARIIQAAALAPAQPSGQDLAVAGQARQLELQARGELAREQSEATNAQAAKATEVDRAYGVTDPADGAAGTISLFA